MHRLHVIELLLASKSVFSGSPSLTAAGRGQARRVQFNSTRSPRLLGAGLMGAPLSIISDASGTQTYLELTLALHGLGVRQTAIPPVSSQRE